MVGNIIFDEDYSPPACLALRKAWRSLRAAQMCPGAPSRPWRPAGRRKEDRVATAPATSAGTSRGGWVVVVVVVVIEVVEVVVVVVVVLVEVVVVEVVVVEVVVVEVVVVVVVEVVVVVVVVVDVVVG